MVAWGFHFSEGGAKTGSGPFIQRLNAAGIPVMMKGTASAGLCYEAQQSGIAHGVDNVIVYRMTNNSEYHYDTPRYDLSPSAAAWAHFEKTAVKWPSELDRTRVWMEPINEPRAKLEPDETTPTWGNMHPVAWLGRFMVEYAQIAQASGFKVCGPSFASGDPEVDLWQLEGMADWLRYCADNPETAAISCHEYNYGATPYYADNYPWHYGRFQAVIAAADRLDIPRTFPILITEFGWKYDWVPWWEQAQPTLAAHTSLCAAFPQVKGVAVWTLQIGWGGISDRLAQWIAPEGNPFANWVINNQIPAATQPQPTAPEFGATLPQQPPDGGEGEPMTTVKRGAHVPFLGGVVNKKLILQERKWNAATQGYDLIKQHQPISLLDETTILYAHVENEEPTDPNPPQAQTLPKGARGVDLSAYQKGFFDKVSPDDFDFFIFRCSDGMNTNLTSNYHDEFGADTELWNFAAVGHASGKPWAIYHYLRPGNVEAQVSKVRMLHERLVAAGTPPRNGVFEDGKVFAGIWPDVEDYALTNDQVKQFVAGVGIVNTVGIYTGKYVWEAITKGAANWWNNKPLWLAAYGTNNGHIPPWNYPALPLGFDSANAWQYTSQGQKVIPQWTGNGLDLNSAGPYGPTTEPPDPPTPPAGQTYDTSFMRGEPGIWRVIRRGDGSGEDVWELPLDSQNDVRVKNTSEGEWYFYGMGGVWRKRDTSPAPDPVTGQTRLYMFNEGGQIAPNEAQVGVTYSYPNVVQFKAKSNCQNLSTNSGPSTSTFLLKEVIHGYTFPGTGVTVDRLYVTVQTSEVQLYAVHQGRTLGWVGGGAAQENNKWAGELAEVHYDRQIPQQEPPRYCS